MRLFEVNERNARDAYWMLHLIETGVLSMEDKESLAFLVKKMKDGIREYNRRSSLESTIIKDYGIDGYIELVQAPESFDDSDEELVHEWFNDTHVTHCSPSPYDCTGQKFTNWYKIFRRRGHWFFYHSVSFDV